MPIIGRTETSSRQVHSHGLNTVCYEQGVTKRYRLSLLTNSALVYEPKCGGRRELRGVSQCVQLYTGAQ
jgi:hypothetical protein